MANATVSVNVTLTCKLRNIQWLENGDYAVTFAMVDPGGIVKRTRNFIFKGDGSGVYDELGAQLAATTPALFLTDVGTVKNDVDNGLTNWAAAQKFTL